MGTCRQTNANVDILLVLDLTRWYACPAQPGQQQREEAFLNLPSMTTPAPMAPAIMPISLGPSPDPPFPPAGLTLASSLSTAAPAASLPPVKAAEDIGPPGSAATAAANGDVYDGSGESVLKGSSMRCLVDKAGAASAPAAAAGATAASGAGAGAGMGPGAGDGPGVGGKVA